MYRLWQKSGHKSAWKRSAAAGLAIAMAAALAAGCSATSSASGQVKTVKTAPVAKVKLDSKQEVDGDAIASAQANIVAKSGGDVAALLKKRGDTVAQGDVLFRLDSTDAERGKDKNRLTKEGLQAQIDKTAQDIATNKSVLRNTIEKLQLQIADLVKSLNNVRNDYDAGAASKSQVEKVETQLSTARLDLDTAQKQLQNLESTDALASLRIQIESTDLSLKDIEKQLSDFEVKAPISGVLTEFAPEQGITVPAGYTAGVIQQLDPIKIHADLTESAVKLVRGAKELPFVVQDSGEAMTGKVVYLADVMSPQSKSFVLELSASNPGIKLKPGMRVKLNLGGSGQQDVLAVPNSSIVKDGNDSFVFVLSGSQVEKRKVTLGRAVDTSREVQGVKDGEQVVVSGQQELKDKDTVTVTK
jgi:HlyD family secretion protein